MDLIYPFGLFTDEQGVASSIPFEEVEPLWLGSFMKQASQGQRMYEYEDSEGVIYYSFTRHKSTLSPTVRLRLRSRIGVHLVNFLNSVRQTGASFQSEEDPDG